MFEINQYEFYCFNCQFSRTINMLKDNAKKLRKQHKLKGHNAHYKKQYWNK